MCSGDFADVYNVQPTDAQYRKIPIYQQMHYLLNI
jgi:hypothetical protein